MSPKTIGAMTGAIPRGAGFVRSLALRLAVVALLVASIFALAAPASAGSVALGGPSCGGTGSTYVSPTWQAKTSGTCYWKYLSCTYWIGGTPYSCGAAWSPGTLLYNFTHSATAAQSSHQLCASDGFTCGSFGYSSAP